MRENNLFASLISRHRRRRIAYDLNIRHIMALELCLCFANPQENQIFYFIFLRIKFPHR